MCRADYTAGRAVQGEILRAFQSLGLSVDWRLAGRRPQPAGTLDEQAARVAMSGRAVGLVRQRMRIGHDEQRLIERLADHAMAERERRDRGRGVARPCLEDIKLPGHRQRPEMAMPDRLWLVDPSNRQAVAKLWACIINAPLCIMGTYGYLTSDQLDDAGVCETLISHWRQIDYADNGERIEKIPGSMIARDLELLGLGRKDVDNGTVITPQRRPMPFKRHPAGKPVAATRPAQARRQPQAPPVPAVPLVIHVQGAAAHG